jgi:hypothetical protein
MSRRKLAKCVCRTRRGIHIYARCPRLLEINRREREWSEAREATESEPIESKPSLSGSLFRVTPLKLKAQEVAPQ